MFEVDWDRYRLVDLSYTVVPGEDPDRPFQATRAYIMGRTFKHDVVTHTHVGTHLEFPAHIFPAGKDGTHFPLTRFMGKALLADLVDVRTDSPITAAFLQRSIGDLVRDGDMVIFRNSDSGNRNGPKENLPYLTVEGAQWIADQKIKLIGVENHIQLDVDAPTSEQIHRLLLGRDICIVECLDNLQALTQREFFFAVLPFKARQLDSAWARAFAIEER